MTLVWVWKDQILLIVLQKNVFFFADRTTIINHVNASIAIVDGLIRSCLVPQQILLYWIQFFYFFIL